MAVFAAIAAVVIPTSASLLSDRRLVRGTDQLRAEMIRLRVRAMKEGRVMVLKAEQESGTLQVTPLFSASDATEALDQTGSQSSLLSGSEQTVAALNTENQASETAARLIELPEDVLVQGIVTSPVGGSGSVEAASLLIAAEQSSDSEAIETNLPVVYFYPTGQTSNAAITLSHPSAGAAVVRLRGLTGDTTVQELSQ